MDILTSLLLICVHALAAWILIELYINTCHKLSRSLYVAFHYVVVTLAFGLIFGFYFSFFAAYSIFLTTMIAIGFILLLEFFVFRFLYSGERWFLTFMDWMIPLFLATTAIYAAGFQIIG